MAGWSSSMKPAAMSAKYRNWASRSGCWRPSVTLALACNEYPKRCNSRNTVRPDTSKPWRHQIVGQLGRRLRRPTQQRHRVTPGLGMHQLIERRQQSGLLVHQGPVTTARGPQPNRRLDPRHHLCLRLDHRVTAHPRRRGYRGLAAPPQHLRRRPRHHPALHLVHVGQHHIEESREPLRRDLHTPRILRAN